MKKTNSSSGRILSIDILRGFDLFLLLFVHPVLVAIGNAYHAGWYKAFMYQMDHEVWEGFRCWDLVMPLFLFMVGASMPFSFSKISRKKVYKRIIRRVLLLFILGMIVQGNLLAFSIDSLKIYNNTLQAIAVGYLIASIIILYTPDRYWILWTLLLLVVYSVPLALFGDYSPTGNFAYFVDKIVIGQFRGDLTYTWVWSSLTFGATVMFGAIAGRLIKKHYRKSDRVVVLRLMSYGAILVVCGWMIGFYEPIIKRIWTSSMTLFSVGWCMILMSCFYFVVDVKGWIKGLSWMKIYGMNAIIAYCLGEVINFRSVIQSLIYGLQPHLDKWYEVCLTFGNCLILFLLLKVMYDLKIFIKV